MPQHDHSVAVFGGGIGGLSAAQELAERGLDVTVYEAASEAGGKARSFPLSDRATPIHGEHGFRFFPAYYRNVVDTMERIPEPSLGPDGSVGDHLVSTSETLVASVEGAEQRSSTENPSSVREWLRSLRPNIGGGEVPNAELRSFLRRLSVLATSCRDRRERELEHTSWWEFLDADNMSSAYCKHLVNSTQSLVALQPKAGSARTVGGIYIQLLQGQIDPSKPAERILDGPTSVTWLDPWVDYLERLGVEVHTDTPLRRLHCDGRAITGATVGAADRAGDERTVEADSYLLAVPAEVCKRLLTPELRRASATLGRVERLETAWMNGLQFFLSEDVELTAGHAMYMDSPWALTSISQRQFWDPAVYDVGDRGGPEIEGVLSVIVSDWDAPGVVHGKPARDCTPEEIRTEVWTQLERHLNRDGRRRLDESLVVDWLLDPELDHDGDSIENAAPLFVNTVGSLDDRPPADPDVDRLYLAGDYVRTETDLATMESANEAARRAANAVLDAAGRRPDVRTWGLDEPSFLDPLKRQDERRYRLGLPHPGEVDAQLRRFGRRLRG
jgi:uncharacterized protein with NAD-binding domain and iron-sulfur cluster